MRPFVALIASTLRETDAQLRLFGREEGGHGAPAGLLEEVGNGTLFIGEIEDLPMSVQRLLIGVLESGRFTRLDGRSRCTLECACDVLRAARVSSIAAGRGFPARSICAV